MLLRRITLLVLALATLAAGPLTAASEARIFDLPYEMRDLPNGLRVIVVRNEGSDLVTIQMPIQTGSRNEVEEGKSGFAHFFEHMMFRGTPRYPDYNAVTQSIGADRNAYTSDDLTNYYLNFTKPDLEKVLDVESDRFMNLRYTEAQFRTESLAVKGEYLKNFSNPFGKLNEVSRELSFSTHTYRHTTIGFFKDIEDMPNQLEYSKVFFDRWYRPEKSTVILVGDLEFAPTFALVEKYFGQWQRGSYDVAVPVEPPATGPKSKHVKWDAPTQPIIYTTFRGPAFRATEKDLPAVDLLGAVWFSPTSDLYQQVVVKERLADTLFFGAPNRKDPHLITVAARLNKPEHAARVASLIQDTLVRARTERVASAKLADIKSNLKYAFASSLDNAQSIGATLASFVHFERTPETINQLYRTYDSLGADDLITAADRYLVDRSRVVVTLSNSDALPGVVEAFDGLDLRVAATRATGAPLKKLEMKTASPLITVNLLFATGAAFDPPGKKGLAQLTASMITDGGTQTRTIRELNEARYPLAAGFGAQVDKEMLRFGGTVHRDNLAAWTELTLEQLLTPGFREDDFARVKQNLVNAIRTNLRGSNDEEFAKEVLYEQVYGPQHPYGSLNLGHAGDIERLTLDDVKAFWRENLTRARLKVGVAGAYDPKWLAEFERSLGKLPAGTSAALKLPAPPRIEGREAIIVQKETSSVALSFGFPLAIGRGDPDWVALWLVRSYLGEHRQGGHLYDRIREARGMNYGDYVYLEYFPRGMFQFFPDPNLARQQQLFQVWIRPLRDNQDAHFAARTAVYELEKLVKQGLSAKDFEDQRRFLDKFVSQMAKTQGQRLGGALDDAWYGTPAFQQYVRDGLRKLTVKDVNRVIKKHLKLDAMKFVFIAKDAEDLVKRLNNDEVSPIRYPTPKPELAAEDAVIEKLPLRFNKDRIRVIVGDTIFE
jgi:zinc protease